MVTQDLPIIAFREEIVSSVAAHPVVVIEADTGAGKSTQVPQFLLAAGYDVVVTQPRRLAAFSVAERVAEEVGCELGTLVGFRTARERKDSWQTTCLYVTDGLALVRELMAEKTSPNRVLVIDEVHEWNLNIETLVAWVKAQLAAGVNYKIVLMSATLETDKLAAHFPSAVKIFVPGRIFSVEVQKPAETIETDVLRLVSEGRNVLVFQPGKAEIEATITTLQESGVAAEIFPLHGSLAHAEQQKCFGHYDRPKVIVSTNVAQTSITIDDIDAVVDSGMERRMELVNKVEGLYLRSVSLSDSKQRAGRAGRTKPGIYIDHCLETDRLEFPVAEIMRVHLDQTVLRLARVACNMEDLSFFHQPPPAQISAARQSLQNLGCLNVDGTITEIGEQVARLPLSAKFGRMVVEAIKLGVVGDVITAAAILEAGEIHARKNELGNPSRKWTELVEYERESDVMAQLRIYMIAGTTPAHKLHAKGIHRVQYLRAKELREHIEGALIHLEIDVTSTGERKNILRAVYSGMIDNLYRVRHGMLVAKDRRKPSSDSVVILKDWVVGIPFDLEVTRDTNKKEILYLVTMITSITLEELALVAPELAKSL